MSSKILWKYLYSAQTESRHCNTIRPKIGQRIVQQSKPTTWKFQLQSRKSTNRPETDLKTGNCVGGGGRGFPHLGEFGVIRIELGPFAVGWFHRNCNRNSAGERKFCANWAFFCRNGGKGEPYKWFDAGCNIFVFCLTSWNHVILLFVFPRHFNVITTIYRCLYFSLFFHTNELQICKKVSCPAQS